MWSTKPAEYSRHRCLHIRLHSLIEIQSSRSVLSDSATPWIAACQASLSITNSRSLLKFMSIQAVMPSNHLILCHPLLLLPSIFLSFRVFSNESVLGIRWTNYWSFTFTSSKVPCSLGSLRLCCDYVTTQLLPLSYPASYIPPWILILKELHNKLSVCSSPSESSSQKT